MVYMEGEKSAALLRWFTENLSTCVFINYEQVYTVFKWLVSYKSNLINTPRSTI